MTEKRSLILEMAAKVDEQGKRQLSNRQIARRVPCSDAYVTRVLGAVRKYEKKKAEQPA